MNTIWADAIRRVETSVARVNRQRVRRSLPAVGEVIAGRTMTGKLYWLGGRQFRQIIGQQPKHAPLDVAAWAADPPQYDGGWVDIDTSFTKVDAHTLESGPGWYRVRVDARDPCAMTFTALRGGAMSMRLTGLDLRAVEPTVIPQGLRWTDVCPDFDVELHLKPRGIEWFRCPKSEHAPRSWAWESEESADFTGYIDWRILGWDNDHRTVRTDEPMFFRRHQQARLTSAVFVTLGPDGTRHTRTEETWTGEVITLQPVTRIKTLSRDVVYPVRIDLTVAVTVDADDVEENQFDDTVSVLGSTYGNLCRADTLTYGRVPGWRFLNVAIGNGDTINDPSTIAVDVNAIAGAGVTATIKFDAVGNAVAWDNTHRPTQITQTSANPPIVLTSTGVKTADIKAAVQEVVNVGAWASGNAMRAAALSPDGAGATSATTGDLTDSFGAVETVIDVAFTAAGGGSTNRLKRRMLMGIG